MVSFVCRPRQAVGGSEWASSAGSGSCPSRPFPHDPPKLPLPLLLRSTYPARADGAEGLRTHLDDPAHDEHQDGDQLLLPPENHRQPPELVRSELLASNLPSRLGERDHVLLCLRVEFACSVVGCVPPGDGEQEGVERVEHVVERVVVRELKKADSLLLEQREACMLGKLLRRVETAREAREQGRKGRCELALPSSPAPSMPAGRGSGRRRCTDLADSLEANDECCETCCAVDKVRDLAERPSGRERTDETVDARDLVEQLHDPTTTARTAGQLRPSQ